MHVWASEWWGGVSCWAIKRLGEMHVWASEWWGGELLGN